MKQKDLAEFHNVTDRTVRRWSDEQVRRKTIQAEADVTPYEWQRIGEIAQLCYLYNAKNWVGDVAVKWAWLEISSMEVSVTFFEHGILPGKIAKASVFRPEELELIKMKLEQLVY